MDRHFGVVHDAACLNDVDETLFEPANAALQARPVSEGGRQAAWFVRLEGSDGALDGVLRHYRRGGLVARLSRESYLWCGAEASRSFAEFHLLADLHAQGLAVPRPLAAAWWRAGLCYRAALITARIPDARPLSAWLQAPVDVSLAQGVARAIAAMHTAGAWHADLNATNILIDGEGRVWLIDFDKARRGPVSARRRQANLARLRRSMRKLGGAPADVWWKGINEAYLQAGTENFVRPG